MKGQDVLVLLKMLARDGDDWTYAGLAHELHMSSSEVHAAVKRCQVAGLINLHTRRPNKTACREFILHGLRYVFPASPGPLVIGIPTSYAAPPLNREIRYDPHQVVVMPHPKGTVRGQEIAPLFRSAPEAATRDERLYEALSLVDALRSGRARERKLAAQRLDAWLG